MTKKNHKWAEKCKNKCKEKKNKKIEINYKNCGSHVQEMGEQKNAADLHVEPVSMKYLTFMAIPVERNWKYLLDNL